MLHLSIISIWRLPLWKKCFKSSYAECFRYKTWITSTQHLFKYAIEISLTKRPHKLPVSSPRLFSTTTLPTHCCMAYLFKSYSLLHFTSLCLSPIQFFPQKPFSMINNTLIYFNSSQNAFHLSAVTKTKLNSSFSYALIMETFSTVKVMVVFVTEKPLNLNRSSSNSSLGNFALHIHLRTQVDGGSVVLHHVASGLLGKSTPIYRRISWDFIGQARNWCVFLWPLFHCP